MQVLLRYTANLLTCIIVPHYYYITYSTLLNYVNLTLFFMGPRWLKSEILNQMKWNFVQT